MLVAHSYIPMICVLFHPSARTNFFLLCISEKLVLDISLSEASAAAQIFPNKMC